jgi:outer membrane protein OmpA-like peptidoglycan-associated protein
LQIPNNSRTILVHEDNDEGGERMRPFQRLFAYLVCAVLGATAPASTVFAETPPSATLKMSSESAGIFFGWHDGTGVLTLQDGSEYEITMDAYSLLSAGYAKAETTGKIYNLKNPGDFAGEYFTTGQSSAFTDGKGDAIFTNDKDVRIELRSKETGVQAGLKFGSATFKLGKRLRGPQSGRTITKALPAAPVAPVKVTNLPRPEPAPIKKPAPVTSKVAPTVKAPVVAPVKPMTAIPAQYTLTFGFNKAKINRAMGQALDSIIQDWKGRVGVFHIIGHADRVGNNKYNSVLSQKRADAVKRALKARGVPADQIVAVGVGDTVPAVATQKGQRLRANRRVVLTVLMPK